MSTRGMKATLVLCVLLSFCLATVSSAHEQQYRQNALVEVATTTTGDSASVEETTPSVPSEDASAEEDGPVVRCRMCGARIAMKKDFMELVDTSKSVSSRHSRDVGERGGHIHTFVNPSRMEMELVAFKKAVGVEGDAFTSKATFFDGYSWKDLRCGGCNRHVGWKFHHDEYQSCVHTSIMESVSAKAHEQMQAATAEGLAKRKELVRKELEGKCVVANAGWWSYEVCYKKEVRQYHQEPDGTRPSDWSMGEYKSDEKETSADPRDGSSSEIAQYFTGGQHCDENGELRNTKVIYTCCSSKPTSPTIENVEEPSLCSYVMTVCVPSLCSDSSTSDAPYDAKAIAAKCEGEFQKTHDEPTKPATFAALRWSTVVSEDSSELDWARAMQFKT